MLGVVVVAVARMELGDPASGLVRVEVGQLFECLLKEAVVLDGRQVRVVDEQPQQPPGGLCPEFRDSLLGQRGQLRPVVLGDGAGRADVFAVDSGEDV